MCVVDVDCGQKLSTPNCDITVAQVARDLSVFLFLVAASLHLLCRVPLQRHQLAQNAGEPLGADAREMLSRALLSPWIRLISSGDMLGTASTMGRGPSCLTLPTSAFES